jgi:hypothetical protein
LQTGLGHPRQQFGIKLCLQTLRGIARVAQKLDTLPDRIKRDNWVAGAKKQHREKYGERL